MPSTLSAPPLRWVSADIPVARLVFLPPGKFNVGVPGEPMADDTVWPATPKPPRSVAVSKLELSSSMETGRLKSMSKS